MWFTDGGIARLRVYGVGQKDWSTVPTDNQVDLIALVNGGVCLGYSDAHFGHPRNMIGMPPCQLVSITDKVPLKHYTKNIVMGYYRGYKYCLLVVQSINISNRIRFSQLCPFH